MRGLIAGMNVFSKIHSLLTNPAMLSAYIRWSSARIFTGGSPRLQLPDTRKISIGEWLSFSEFWSFQDTIPLPERLYAEHCLVNANGQSAIAVDIGANVGLFTLFLASKGCLVHAFEPIPATFCRLKNNVKYSNFLDVARLNCLAVGNGPGLVTFQVWENAPATNRMILYEKASTESIASTQVVATVSLDDYCDNQRIDQISFLKIDVEGMEPLVIKGAYNLLKQRKISSALIEICPVNLHSVGFTCSDLFKELESLPYSLFILNENGTPGSKLLLSEIEQMSLINAALLPDA